LRPLPGLASGPRLAAGTGEGAGATPRVHRAGLALLAAGVLSEEPPQRVAGARAVGHQLDAAPLQGQVDVSLGRERAGADGGQGAGAPEGGELAGDGDPEPRAVGMASDDRERQGAESDPPAPPTSPRPLHPSTSSGPILGRWPAARP